MKRRQLLKGTAAGLVLAVNPASAAPANADAELFEALARYHKVADQKDRVSAELTAIEESVKAALPEYEIVAAELKVAQEQSRPRDEFLRLADEMHHQGGRRRQAEIDAGYPELDAKFDELHDEAWRCMDRAMSIPAQTDRGMAAKVNAILRRTHAFENLEWATDPGMSEGEIQSLVLDAQRLFGRAS